MDNDKKKFDELVRTAKDRFKRCMDFEGTAIKLFREDMKFSNGDSDNHYQWPNEQLNARNSDARPCLTINKTFQHNLLIINDIRQNMPTIKIHPVGDEGTYQSAEVFQDVIRYIEYNSNASLAYEKAVETQVQGGIGYWRIVTDYADDKSFDSDIFIRPIKDATSVLLDCDCLQPDGSDAEYGYVFVDYPKDVYKRKFGKAIPQVSASAGLGDSEDTWITEDTIRVAEYYVKEYTKDELWAVPSLEDPDDVQVLPMSKVPEELRSEYEAREGFRKRPVDTVKVRWYLIAGGEVIDDRDVPCSFIPIVRVVGWETVIDGKLDRKGHTRQLKDPNRMYNYWASSSVEYVALQGKQPYIGDARSFEGYEKYWETYNTENYGFLPYNGVDDNGNSIERPQRQEPPVMAQGYIQGLQNASNEMAMVSGQYQNQFGAPGPEEAGVAIQARRRQGGVSTFHFTDNFATAIRFSARILIDMIPRVYDTKRVINTMGLDGSAGSITIDPNQPQGTMQTPVQGSPAAAASVIFNPKVGKFNVVAEAGPNYQTRREEAFAALSNIIGHNEKLLGLAGDLMFKAADFPFSDEIAERLARTVPDEIRTGQPNPQVVQLQQQIQHLEQLLQLADRAVKEKSGKIAVEEYRAETDRLHALMEHESFDPREAKAVIQKTVAEVTEGLLPLPPTMQQPAPGANPVPTNPQGAQ